MEMESFIPVKDHPNMVRDPHSKAINFTDTGVIDKYKKETAKVQEIEKLKGDVENIMAEMTDIKQLLLQLLHKA